MSHQTVVWNDRRIEIIIGTLLRIGVVIATSVVLLGGILYLLKYGASTPQYGVFRGEPAEFENLGGIVEAALALRGRGIIQFGLILLMATPVARVVFSVVAFAIERDYLYVGITLIVLVLLLLSIFVF